jgi:hypothetical protein
MTLLTKHIIYAIIAFAVLLVVVYFGLISFVDIPAWAALIIAAFSIYYSSESLIMDVKIKHSEDLHKFIAEWKRVNEGFYYKIIPLMGAEFQKNELKFTRPQYSLESINNDILYTDLTKNHLEGKYKELLENWRKYCKLAEEFETKLNDLRSYIQKLVMKELSTAGLSQTIDYNYKGNDVVNPWFIDTLFSNYISDIDKSQQIKVQEINYSLPETQSMAKGYQVTLTKNNGLFSGSIAIARNTQNAEKYVAIFENLQKESSNTKDKELKAMLSDISKKGEGISTLFQEVSKTLVDLDKYPVFGEKCEFIRRAL